VFNIFSAKVYQEYVPFKMEMRISDHVLEIERGRYNKINREQRICRQCHLNVIENEEHFFFHCQKNELLRKEFLTQIENL
jgi:hypothetical protein